MKKLALVFLVVALFLASAVSVFAYGADSGGKVRKSRYNSVTNHGATFALPPILPEDVFTVEGWFKAERLSQGAHYIFLQASYGSGVEFGVSINGGNAKGGFLQVLYWDSTGAKYVFVPAPVFSWGEWHHVAVSKDGSFLRIFLDGKMLAEEPYQGTEPYYKPFLFAVGGYASYHSSGSARFTGMIDEVRVSKVARYRTDFRVRSRPLKADKKTLALIGFNGDFRDYSGNGNDCMGYGSWEFSRDSAFRPKVRRPRDR